MSTSKVLTVKRKPFYYDAQLKRYLIQVMLLFSGYQVVTGKQRDGEVRFIDVPVMYGNTDRMVQYIKAGGNMNKLTSLPLMSVSMSRMELSKDRRRAPTHVNTTHYAEYLPNAVEEANPEADGGGMIKRAVDRYMPTPYDLYFDLNIMASNTDQLCQMTEQIGQHYNMNVDMVTSNSPFDWTGLTTLDFQGTIEFEPAPEIGGGGESKNIVSVLSFNTVIQLSPPAIVRDADEVAKINIMFKQMNVPINFDTMQDLDNLVIVGGD